jgi:hypothetical protein
MRIIVIIDGFLAFARQYAVSHEPTDADGIGLVETAALLKPNGAAHHGSRVPEPVLNYATQIFKR